ncbi:MAG: hypothetical protein WCY00_00750 [Candidatus Dojkabacteria bacterium]
MSIGTMVLVIVGCIILAIIAGIVTRSVFVGILFPILLVIFILMWRSLKKDSTLEVKEEELKEEGDITEEAVADVQQTQEIEQQTQQPPVSTSYPPVR